MNFTNRIGSAKFRSSTSVYYYRTSGTLCHFCDVTPVHSPQHLSKFLFKLMAPGENKVTEFYNPYMEKVHAGHIRSIMKESAGHFFCQWLSSVSPNERLRYTHVSHWLISLEISNSRDCRLAHLYRVNIWYIASAKYRLYHYGLVTPYGVRDVTIGSNNNLSPMQHQAITCTNDGILCWTIRNKLQYALNKNTYIIVKEIHLKNPSAKVWHLV